MPDLSTLAGMRGTTSEAEARAGVFIAVVGPSGAGKDTLIAYARERLASNPRILFVRRVVTREAQGGAEDHDTMALEEFCAAEKANCFAVTWDAHGLRYGLPAETVRHVSQGGAAVANCSRAALGVIGDRFGNLKIISVTASAQVRAQRLAGRGRETIDEVERRLLRTVVDFPQRRTAIEIDNSGDLVTAGEHFTATIAALARIS